MDPAGGQQERWIGAIEQIRWILFDAGHTDAVQEVERILTKVKTDIASVTIPDVAPDFTDDEPLPPRLFLALMAYLKAGKVLYSHSSDYRRIWDDAHRRQP